MSDKIIKIADEDEDYFGFQVRILEGGIELQYTEGNIEENYFQIEDRDLPKLVEVLNNIVKERGFNAEDI